MFNKIEFQEYTYMFINAIFSKLNAMGNKFFLQCDYRNISIFLEYYQVLIIIFVFFILHFILEPKIFLSLFQVFL